MKFGCPRRQNKGAGGVQSWCFFSIGLTYGQSLLLTLLLLVALELTLRNSGIELKILALITSVLPFQLLLRLLATLIHLYNTLTLSLKPTGKCLTLSLNNN